MTALLEVAGLTVAYGDVEVVRDMGFSVQAGEALGIVGESGSGKTQSMLAVLRLLARGGRIAAGSVRLEGRELTGLSHGQMRALRGRAMAYVAQDALSALNPVMTIGTQMAEPLIVNEGMTEEAALARCVELLEQVGIPGAAARLGAYPHQLSGGMRQRVLIAMAIGGRPKLLIADEPTTALDVTIQAQILRLLGRLQRELGMALVLISHDLGVVAGIADRVAIMYAGRIVETAAASELFARPAHPYARGLLGAKPRLDHPDAAALRPIPGLPPDPSHLPAGCAFHPRCTLGIPRCTQEAPRLAPVGEAGHLAACWRSGETLEVDRASDLGVLSAEVGGMAEQIVVEDLHVHFPIRSGVLRRAVGAVRAVDGVSFAVPKGQTVALVGESGSGKTTTGRALVGLAPLARGRVSLFGRALGEVRRAGVLPRLGQMVFQDPYGSLNPRMTVGTALSEVLAVHGRAGRAADLLDSVGLRAEVARRRPRELSGGQRQRVAIARALAIEPAFMVCDEVVSALDVSIQGQIVNLLMELQRARGLTYLFISHDLALVRHVAHRIVVMYGGKVMEAAPRDALFAQPRHPYTRALLQAVPIADPAIERGRRRAEPTGETPDPAAPPPGCRFHPACRFATEQCRVEEPVSIEDNGHAVACHHWKSIAEEHAHA